MYCSATLLASTANLLASWFFEGRSCINNIVLDAAATGCLASAPLSPFGQITSLRRCVKDTHHDSAAISPFTSLPVPPKGGFHSLSFSVNPLLWISIFIAWCSLIGPVAKQWRHDQNVWRPVIGWNGSAHYDKAAGEASCWGWALATKDPSHLSSLLLIDYLHYLLMKIDNFT